MEQGITVNLEQEIEQAKQSNKAQLEDFVRAIIFKQHQNDVGLFLLMLSGELDNMVQERIKDLMAEGLVDNQYMPVIAYDR